MEAICKGCGNTGIDICGKPCSCKLSPEWRKHHFDTVEQLRNSNDRTRRLLQLLKWFSVKHNLLCYDCKIVHGFCTAHDQIEPCPVKAIREELAL